MVTNKNFNTEQITTETTMDITRCSTLITLGPRMEDCRKTAQEKKLSKNVSREYCNT